MLTITQALWQQIVEHCQHEYPKEACGMVAGRDGLVQRVFPMRNVDASPISYQMDPKEQLLVMKQMRQANQSMQAIYHSHTASPAYPSPVDVSLAVYPDVNYILVSLKDQANPVVESYRILDGKILPDHLHVKE
jgi:proteasome lid subunit RPN8/RPN11